VAVVDMPFGQKPDLKSGGGVDFDKIYNDAINRRSIMPLKNQGTSCGKCLRARERLPVFGS
jgi:hypothetical protein